jgi:hypothetical protein
MFDHHRRQDRHSNRYRDQNEHLFDGAAQLLRLFGPRTIRNRRRGARNRGGCAGHPAATKLDRWTCRHCCRDPSHSYQALLLAALSCYFVTEASRRYRLLSEIHRMRSKRRAGKGAKRRTHAILSLRIQTCTCSHRNVILSRNCRASVACWRNSAASASAGSLIVIPCNANSKACSASFSY